MSKVEIYKFMKRFMGDNSHLDKISHDKNGKQLEQEHPKSVCWDPN